MKGTLQNTMRRLTRLGRPLGLRSAGKEGSTTSIVRHVGRRSRRTYETPVVAVKNDDDFLIALPYGRRTDWLQNVLADGGASLVMQGHTYRVDRPEVIPIGEANSYFRQREQNLHRRFGVDTALRLHRAA